MENTEGPEGPEGVTQLIEIEYMNFIISHTNFLKNYTLYEIFINAHQKYNKKKYMFIYVYIIEDFWIQFTDFCDLLKKYDSCLSKISIVQEFNLWLIQNKQLLEKYKHKIKYDNFEYFPDYYGKRTIVRINVNFLHFHNTIVKFINDFNEYIKTF